eukprot:gene7834-8684_t
MNVESWCTVERSSSQDWKRAERGHFDGAFRSSVLKPTKACQEDRFSAGQGQLQDSKHREKRHFKDKYDHVFKI